MPRQILVHPSSGYPRVTTNSTTERDLRISLLSRSGVPAGLTFGDFISAMRQLGVTDATPLASIEYGCGQFGNGRLTRDDASDGVEIREGR